MDGVYIASPLYRGPADIKKCIPYVIRNGNQFNTRQALNSDIFRVTRVR